MEPAGKYHQYHFVLVHGAGHGAWCWYKVVAALQSDGHHVTALDMAAAGVNPKRIEELSSFFDYCRPLMDFMAALPPDDRVVLVGHSMGGICISLAMETFPEKISVAVFAGAIMPCPGFPASAVYPELLRHVESFMDSEHFFANGVDSPPTSLLFGPNFLASQLYQLSPAEDLTLATMLMRPVSFFDGFSELAEPSKEKYGSVRRAYVVGERDNVCTNGFQEWMIQNISADEMSIIPGADHMLMFSQPLEFCTCLKDLANKFC